LLVAASWIIRRRIPAEDVAPRNPPVSTRVLTPLPHIAVHIPAGMPTAKRLRLAQGAEALGCQTAWLAEDLFYRGAMSIAGAIVASTKRISVGLGVITPWVRNPALTAMEVRSLLEMAPGRLKVGIGTGVRQRIEKMGMEFARPVSRVRDEVETLRALMQGEVATTGSELRLTNHEELQDLSPPPIYVAAIGERSMAQAVAIGDGVLLSMMCSRAHVSWARDVATSEASHQLDFVANVPLLVSEDPAIARALAVETVARYIRRWADIPMLTPLFTRFGPFDDASLADSAAALGAGVPADSVVSVDHALEYCIAGTISECSEQLASYGEAGLTTIALDPSGYGDEGFGDFVSALGSLSRRGGG